MKWKCCRHLPTKYLVFLDNLVGPVTGVTFVFWGHFCHPGSKVLFSLKWTGFLCCRVSGCRSGRRLYRWAPSHHTHSHQLSHCLAWVLPGMLFPRYLLGKLPYTFCSHATIPTRPTLLIWFKVAPVLPAPSLFCRFFPLHLTPFSKPIIYVFTWVYYRWPSPLLDSRAELFVLFTDVS